MSTYLSKSGESEGDPVERTKVVVGLRCENWCERVTARAGIGVGGIGVGEIGVSDQECAIGVVAGRWRWREPASSGGRRERVLARAGAVCTMYVACSMTDSVWVLAVDILCSQ